MRFNDAPIKAEGQMVDFDGTGIPPKPPEVDITWIERRVPNHLFNKLDLLIDKFLDDHGYNPEEI